MGGLHVALEAPFDRYSGYGNDGVDLALGIAERVDKITLIVTSLIPGLPRAFTRLLEPEATTRPDVLLKFSQPAGSRGWESRERVGVPQMLYTMWERHPFDPTSLTVDPEHHWPEDRPPIIADDWDAMAVCAGMNVEGFRSIYPFGPIHHVPAGIRVDDWPEAPRDRTKPLSFLMVGALTDRKNPFAFLDGWKQFKADTGVESTAHLHTTARGFLHPMTPRFYPDVTMSGGAMPRADLVKMYHNHDVLMAPSKGEGNNKPAMEMLATGGTVAATDWGGHQNWLHRDVAYTIGGHLEPVPAMPGEEWFVATPEDVYATLQEIHSDEEGLRRKQMAAHRYAQAALGWDSTIDTLLRHLTGLL